MAKKVPTPEEVEAKQAKSERIKACQTLEELQELGQEFGYKDGWAVHAWDFHASNPIVQEKLRAKEETI